MRFGGFLKREKRQLNLTEDQGQNVSSIKITSPFNIPASVSNSVVVNPVIEVVRQGTQMFKAGFWANTGAQLPIPGFCLDFPFQSGNDPFLRVVNSVGGAVFTMSTFGGSSFELGWGGISSFQFVKGSTNISGYSSILGKNFGLHLGTTGSNNQQIICQSATNTATSGQNNALEVRQTWNQIGSTAANTDLLINRTETQVGSGKQYLIDAQVAGKSKFKITNKGKVVAKILEINQIAAGEITAGNFVGMGIVNGMVVSTQFDKTNSAALSDVTDLTFNVLAGKTYRLKAHLFYDANITGGHKYAIAGTCTATLIKYHVKSISDATNSFVITSRQTALAGAAGQAGSTAGCTIIEGVITVNVAGTLTIQFAQNSATISTTSSILTGSIFEVTQIT